MKKKVLIISVTSFLAIVVLLLIILTNRVKYTIIVSMIDDYSPDRILTVYNEKNEKVEVKRIEYLDGTLLCSGYNMAVHYGDVENEKELKVILKDKSEVKAKVILEEVKR